MNLLLVALLFIRCLWKQMLHAKSFAERLNGGTFSLHEKNEDIIRFRRKKKGERMRPPARTRNVYKIY